MNDKSVKFQLMHYDYTSYLLTTHLDYPNYTCAFGGVNRSVCVETAVWCVFRQLKPAPEQKLSQLTIKLRNVMMQLRKCCSHPFLLEHPLDPKTGELCLDERIVSQSGKMLVLDRMLKELQRRQHKVERTVFAFLCS